MNKNVKLVLWIGIGIVVIMTVFPPWAYSDSKHNWSPASYRPLFAPPSGYYFGVRVDFTRLALQWFAVAVLTAGGIVTLKDQKEDHKAQDA